MPLGLAQAAALIAREHLEYGAYLRRLRSVPVADYLGRVEGDAYPYRTAEAILLSLRGVEQADPSGRCIRLMGLVAVLAETGISRRLVHLAAAGDDVSGMDPRQRGCWRMRRWSGSAWMTRWRRTGW